MPALDGKHADVIRLALARLAARFIDPNPDESYRRDGPVAYALFEDAAGRDKDEELRNARILRRRRAADLMSAFLLPLVG